MYKDYNNRNNEYLYCGGIREEDAHGDVTGILVGISISMLPGA